MNKLFRNRQNSGITLIALVVTIIVLLILAGVSISMLTGKNGILTQAETAKTDTQKKEALEKIQLETAGSLDNNGNYSLNLAKSNLEKNLSIPTEDIIGNGDGTLTVNYQGYEFKVEENGKVTLIERTDEAIIAKKVSEIQNSCVEEKTTALDEYGNKIVVPEGFKILVNDDTNNATHVTEGIVITDGINEFVWIPVGNIKTSKEDSTGINAILCRSDFFDTETQQADEMIRNYQELSSSTLGNATAKNIQNFIDSSNNNGGYYLGRYEAREKDNTTTVRTSSSSQTLDLVCNKNNIVYNYITQPNASALCQKMYTGRTFTSDLVNSFAWDTALKWFERVEEQGVYKYGYFGNNPSDFNGNEHGVFYEKGNESDKIFNVYNMATNYEEWSTETDKARGFTGRGGYNNFSSSKVTDRNSYGVPSIKEASFRPILYIN